MKFLLLITTFLFLLSSAFAGPFSLQTRFDFDSASNETTTKASKAADGVTAKSSASVMNIDDFEFLMAGDLKNGWSYVGGYDITKNQLEDARLIKKFAFGAELTIGRQDDTYGSFLNDYNGGLVGGYGENDFLSLGNTGLSANYTILNDHAVTIQWFEKITEKSLAHKHKLVNINGSLMNKMIDYNLNYILSTWDNKQCADAAPADITAHDVATYGGGVQYNHAMASVSFDYRQSTVENKDGTNDYDMTSMIAYINYKGLGQLVPWATYTIQKGELGGTAKTEDEWTSVEVALEYTPNKDGVKYFASFAQNTHEQTDDAGAGTYTTKDSKDTKITLGLSHTFNL